ncbi:MAG: beta-lactamase family protein [Acetobacteraceae bacterium]|nr:beta-lactamase family protein [Acetobacteraceae bacterium]
MSDLAAILRPYEGDVPGAALLVVRAGEPVVRRGWGLADLEARVAVTPATNFRLASLTKAFTAAAVLILAEEGRLALDDAARTWLPSLPATASAITLRHLLNHTSGLIDYEAVMPAATREPLRDADVLRLLEAQDRTYFPPGKDYRYSNGGYALLALVVSRASGEGFARFLEDRIFAPLGMQGSVAHEAGVSSIRHRAFGYSSQGGRWIRTDQDLTSAVLGDGGIYSSIEDLAKWDAALQEPGLLSAESLRLAFTHATATDAADVHYGCGWRITGETVWHSGETIGFRNVIVRWPRRRCSVILLTNRDDPPPYGYALAIAKLLFRGEHERAS